MVSVVVLLASCGGGSPLEPPQAPAPPSTAAQAEAVPTVTEAAKSSAETVVAEAVPAVADTAATKTVTVTATEEAVPVVTAADAAATTTTAVAVDAEPSTTTAAAASSTTTAAAAGETPTETVTPSTTVSENAVVRVDESVREAALEVMLQDLQPAEVVMASFFGVTDDQAGVDFCLEESNGEGKTYRHVARVADLTASGWEISGRFDILVLGDLESCVASFN